MKAAVTAKFKRTSQSHGKLVSLMAEWVAADFRPLSAVDDPGFRKILEHVNARYQPVSRAAVRSELMRQETEFDAMVTEEL